MTNRALSLAEMRRVLRPGGGLFVLEFSHPHAWFRPVYFIYLRHILPAIAGWLTANRSAYAYLNRTIEAFPGRAALAGEIRAAGFQECGPPPWRWAPWPFTKPPLPLCEVIIRRWGATFSRRIPQGHS